MEKVSTRTRGKPIDISGITCVSKLNAINWQEYADPQYNHPFWWAIGGAYSIRERGLLIVSNGDLERLVRLCQLPESKWTVTAMGGELWVRKWKDETYYKRRY